MPVHFRCSYCRQLLGISRRKAGTVVRCPKCTNQVVVPKATRKNTAPTRPSDEAERRPAEGAAAAGEEPVLDRSDFDEVFARALKAERRKARRARRASDAGKAGAVAPVAPTAGPSPADVPAAPGAVGPVAAPAAAALSPGTITWLSVAGLVALALAFAAGVFVGLYVGRSTAPAQTSLAPAAGRAPGGS